MVKLLQESHIVNLEDVEADGAVLESFNLRNLSTETLLFQTGYITIKNSNQFGLYQLGYPNREVRESMLRHMIDIQT